ncbi:PssD/Cps14F family polysaccharide biosynthesis glycosyltransferase [Arenicella sp. 4NH20-0111]|uniref:UDP-N-acetylglucosamine--LPS N-acetylglucosamine transferase n=1 Tax=Arenicella sp. 4NH20-0111 TaxID=3127648 RepID=UPI003104AA8C
MRSRKKILAVASAGGHWTQLTLLKQSFEHHDIQFVTTNLNHAKDSQQNISIVLDADISQKLRLIVLATQSAFLVLKYRPDVVISTGAAPGFFAILFGKLIRSRTIWIDSLANASKLSLSGQQAKRFCDVFLTQWEDLSDGNSIQYKGSLL